MVSKDGELDDAQPEPVPRITEAVFDDLEAPSAAKVPNAERDAQGDEDRRSLVETRPGLVRDARARRRELSPRSLSLAAPLRQSQCKLFHLIGDSLPNPLVTHHRSSGGKALPVPCSVLPRISRLVDPEVYFWAVTPSAHAEFFETPIRWLQSTYACILAVDEKGAFRDEGYSCLRQRRRPEDVGNRPTRCSIEEAPPPSPAAHVAAAGTRWPRNDRRADRPRDGASRVGDLEETLSSQEGRTRDTRGLQRRTHRRCRQRRKVPARYHQARPGCFRQSARRSQFGRWASEKSSVKRRRAR